MSQQKLYNFLYKFLFGHYGKSKIITDAESEWMIAIGDIPVMLCAHLDTVFERPPINIFTDKEKHVMWAPAGLGADDRAGVYAIMNLILDGYKPSILFTTGEERGCIGAIKLVNNYPECPVYGLKCLIQLDRRNNGESVYYSCKNTDFEGWINSYGFYTNLGTFTDISVLCPAWGIAGVNLSVGYYNEHTTQEYLKYNELEETINKVTEMLQGISKQDKFIYIRDPHPESWLDKSFFLTCDFCGNPLNKTYYKMRDGGYEYNLCPDCAKFYTNLNKSEEKENDFKVFPPI